MKAQNDELFKDLDGIEALEDVIELLGDPDFDTILDDYLEKMPYSRESVDEMLEVISSWELWPVYNALLTDYAKLLTQEELEKLKANYRELFSIPLPGEYDQDLLEEKTKEYKPGALKYIMEYMDYPDFDTFLDDYLEKMPYSRESVDELLEVVSSWDLWSVYNKLLADYTELLSKGELKKLKADYRELFSIPLP
ncbi:MAG: hypothetical protein IJ773_13645 [Lachnospiraceae bacterium]|nr:hypothetical protein [Lachnospiraceae bacterium]